MADHLFSLPYELRLQIYSYLHKPQLELDFCKDLTKMRLTNLSPEGRASPLLAYLQKRRLASQWARTHGLHLLVTSRRLRNEYLQLVDNSNTSLTIHCSRCFDRLLCHLTRDLNLHVAFVKTVWTLVKTDDPWQSSSTETLVHDISSLMTLVRTVLRANYGSCEGRRTGLRDPYDHRLRSWTLQKTKVVGRMIEIYQQTVQQEVLADADNEDNDGDESFDSDHEFEDDPDGQGWFLHGQGYHYPHRPVQELDRTTRSMTILDEDYPAAGNLTTAKKFLEKVQPVSDLDQWRISRRLKNEWRAKGRNAKKLRIRDELWLGVQMRP